MGFTTRNYLHSDPTSRVSLGESAALSSSIWVKQSGEPSVQTSEPGASRCSSSVCLACMAGEDNVAEGTQDV